MASEALGSHTLWLLHSPDAHLGLCPQSQPLHVGQMDLVAPTVAAMWTGCGQHGGGAVTPSPSPGSNGAAYTFCGRPSSEVAGG